MTAGVSPGLMAPVCFVMGSGSVKYWRCPLWKSLQGRVGNLAEHQRLSKTVGGAGDSALMSDFPVAYADGEEVRHRGGSLRGLALA